MRTIGLARVGILCMHHCTYAQTGTSTIQSRCIVTEKKGGRGVHLNSSVTAVNVREKAKTLTRCLKSAKKRPPPPLYTHGHVFLLYICNTYIHFHTALSLTTIIMMEENNIFGKVA